MPDRTTPKQQTSAVVVPLDECICDGTVAKPRRNCWATTHNLQAPK
jgi:hypothetical protein